MVTFGLIVVAILIWAVSSGSRSGPELGSARRVLDELYASGEITEQEYLERREVLSRP